MCEWKETFLSYYIPYSFKDSIDDKPNSLLCNSRGVNVSGVKDLGGKYVGGESPEGKYLGGESPGGK